MLVKLKKALSCGRMWFDNDDTKGHSPLERREKGIGGSGRLYQKLGGRNTHGRIKPVVTSSLQFAWRRDLTWQASGR